jgi:hypothetical protein
MLDIAEPLQGAHALILCTAGPTALDILCGLIRRGCDAASELPPDGRLSIAPTELVLVPVIANLPDADRAIRMARRGLLPCGRIVLRSPPHLAPAIAATLRIAGFSDISRHQTSDSTIIAADLPMFGPKFTSRVHA